MQVVKISFKTDKGQYSLYTTSKQLRCILTDELFTVDFVEAKTGKVINHGEEINKIIETESIEKSTSE